MEGIPVSQSRVRLAQLMTPNDANVLGNVFGGSILALIDLAASSVAQKFSGHVCVTAAFDRVDFHNPIEIGMLVELDGVVSYVGRTSLEVTIDVYATRLTKNERHHVNTARVTMVAIGNGKPVPVPRLICETREDKLRFLSGQLRRELKAQRTEQMATLTARLENSPDIELDSLLENPDSLGCWLS